MTSTGKTQWRQPSRHDCGAGRSDRSALHPLHVGDDRTFPKAIVRDNGGHAVALQWTMRNIYGVQARRRLLGGVRRRLGRRALLHRLRAAPSTGTRRILYEGKPVGTPDAGAFWRVIVRITGCALRSSPRPPRCAQSSGRIPTGAMLTRRLRPLALRASVPRGRALRSGHARGRSALLGVPVIDHWWQTETGWAICANCLGIEQLPVKHGLAHGASSTQVGTCRSVVDEGGEPSWRSW